MGQALRREEGASPGAELLARLNRKYGLEPPGTPKARHERPAPIRRGSKKPPEPRPVELLPGRSIGELALGMTREEIEAVLERRRGEEAALDDPCAPLYPGPLKMAESVNDGVVSVRYFVTPYELYLVDYEGGRAAAIGVQRDVLARYVPTLYGMSVFETHAEDVVSRLKEYGPCTCDEADELLGYSYTFETLGLSLWREGVYHPKLLEDRAFRETFQGELLAEEMGYWYFEIVTVQERRTPSEPR